MQQTHDRNAYFTRIYIADKQLPKAITTEGSNVPLILQQKGNFFLTKKGKGLLKILSQEISCEILYQSGKREFCSIYTHIMSKIVFHVSFPNKMQPNLT